MQVPRPARNSLLVIHIGATVSVLGADLVLLVLGLTGLTGSDPIATYPAASLIGSRVVAPLAIVSLASGVLLGLVTTWGLVRYWWTTIKLSITVALTAVVLLVLVPGLEASADQAVAGAVVTDSERLSLVIAPLVGSSLLLVNVTLAVFKPARRLRASAPDEQPSAAVPEPAEAVR